MSAWHMPPPKLYSATRYSWSKVIASGPIRQCGAPVTEEAAFWTQMSITPWAMVQTYIAEFPELSCDHGTKLSLCNRCRDMDCE